MRPFWILVLLVSVVMVGRPAFAQHEPEPHTPTSPAPTHEADGEATPVSEAIGHDPAASHGAAHEEGGILESVAEYPFFFKPALVGIHMAAFLIFFVILKSLLFDPLLAFMAHRQGGIDAGMAALTKERKSVEALQAKYDAALAQADKLAYERQQEIIRASIAAKSEAVAKAHADALAVAVDARKAVAAAKTQALAELRAQVGALGEAIAQTAMK